MVYFNYNYIKYAWIDTQIFYIKYAFKDIKKLYINYLFQLNFNYSMVSESKNC